MSANVRIEANELRVNQWVQFLTSQDLSAAPVEQQEIYQPSRCFLVISRADALLDPCRCYLVDIAGKKYDYCPRVGSLGSTRLVEMGEIEVVSREDVELIHGVEKVYSVYKAAQMYLKELAKDLVKHPARIPDYFKFSATETEALQVLNRNLKEVGIPPILVGQSQSSATEAKELRELKWDSSS